MMYDKYLLAAKQLFKLYSDDIPLPVDYQDIAHDVMALADFEELPIALFCYRFKNQLKKAKSKWYLYQKRMDEYYKYESTPMPDLFYPDFPVGASTKECIEFIYSKLNRPMTVKEVVMIIKNDDYTRRFYDVETSVKMCLSQMNPIYRKKCQLRANKLKGICNGKSVMTVEKQSEAKRLFALWGKRYTAIGRQLNVSKTAVSNFINGRSYVNNFNF